VLRGGGAAPGAGACIRHIRSPKHITCFYIYIHTPQHPTENVLPTGSVIGWAPPTHHHHPPTLPAPRILCASRPSRGVYIIYLYLAHGLWPATELRATTAFEQIKPDYLLWGCFRWSFASASTPAGCLLQLIHGLDEVARGAKSYRKQGNKQRTV
jgi:hypothetical protein